MDSTTELSPDFSVDLAWHDRHRRREPAVDGNTLPIDIARLVPTRPVEGMAQPQRPALGATVRPGTTGRRGATARMGRTVSEQGGGREGDSEDDLDRR